LHYLITVAKRRFSDTGRRKSNRTSATIIAVAAVAVAAAWQLEINTRAHLTVCTNKRSAHRAARPKADFVTTNCGSINRSHDLISSALACHPLVVTS